jgi:raffinose/stachyose/melibiose transport system substrate-binding protein
MLLSACSSGGGGSTPQAADTSGPAPKGVTLTLWRSPLDSKALDNLYKAYEAASGNKLDIVAFPTNAYETTVKTKWATGTKPDILEFHSGLAQLVQLNPAKNLVDLSRLDFVAREGDLAKSAGNINGHVYSAVLGPLAAYGMFYNKKVFAAAGLQPPKTYDDLMTACTAIKKTPGVAPIFEAGGEGWPPQILAGLLYESSANVGGAYVSSLMDGTSSLTDPNGAFVKGLTAYDDLRKSGCFNSDSATAKLGDSADALIKGKAALVAQYSDALIPLLEKADPAAADSVGFVGVSATGPQVAYTPNLSGTFEVPKTGDATKERAATDFINWITGPGYAQYVKDAGAQSTMSGVQSAPQKGLAADVAKSVSNSSAFCWLTNLPAATAVGDLADQLLAGQISPTAAAKRMDTAFQAAKRQLQN